MSRLRSDNVTLAHEGLAVVSDIDLSIPDGKITTILGPNGCGKSTLLRALARLKRADGGSVILDGQLIHHMPTRDVAKKLGLLSQQSITPGGITVRDLVRRGRYPHQSFLQPPSRADEEIIDHALELAGMTDLQRRAVDELSGGQRQRAWIAMVLAQETPLLLLDEPTTFLDMAHQMQVIDLVQRLNANEQRTVGMVLHDVNEAARVSHHMIAMSDGKILREGAPHDIVDQQLLAELYGVECDVYHTPGTGHPFCVPRSVVATDPNKPAPVQGLFNVNGLKTGYGNATVLHGLSLELPAGAVTAIIGPNACGKSTLLRTCGRLLRPSSGRVEMHGSAVHKGRHRAFSRQLALLTQGPAAPSGFLVEDLVASGRVPHQGFLKQWREEDERAVDNALGWCNLADLRFREIETLSGGQRQRAWLGLTLAQDTPVLLLDEPTTFLDIAAQIELLDLVRTLNQEQGRSVVMVLHDINLAARYADHLVAMKDGEVIAAGRPSDILTAELLRAVFDIEATIVEDPLTGTPLVMPSAVAATAGLSLLPAYAGDLVPA
jgi:iron complex transport system ATP-binding protein